MGEGRLYHLSMGVIGLSLGVSGALTGVGDVAGAAVIAGGTCLVVVSAYSLLTDADSPVGRRGTYLSVFGALLAVAGTVLMLLG